METTGLTRAQQAVLFAMSASALLSNAAIAPAIPDIRDHFGQSDSASVFILMSVHAPGLFMASIIGVAADRYGRRTVIVPCLVIFGIGGLLSMAAVNFTMLIGARLLQGIGSAAFVNLAVVIIGDNYTGVERTRVLGRNSMAITAGIAIIPAVGGFLDEAFGWRGPFVLTALPLFVAVAAAKVLRNDRPEITTSFGRQLTAARGQVRRPEVKFLLLIAFMGYVMFFGASVTALPLHLEKQYDAGPSIRGLILASPAAGSVCMALLLGRIASRVTTGFLTACGFAIYAGLIVACGLAPTLLLAALPVFFIGFGEVLITVPLQSHTAAISPPDQRGAMVAAWATSVRLGQLTAPLFAAIILSVADTRVLLVSFGGWAALICAIVIARKPLLDD
ncbi:MAG: MFS transporter [Acidimicrobiales bacterium]